MKLLTLELENWSLHEHLRISLANGLQIEGRNGTGKSSILEAIRFIFAKDSRRYKRRIRHGTRGSTVRLWFIKDNNEYMVEKRIFLNRKSTARILMNSKLIADGPSSVYNYLRGILPEDIIDRLVYVPQGELVEFIDELALKGGRQKLDSLLGLDKFENVDKGIKEEISELKGKLEILEKEIMKYPEDAEEKFREMIREMEVEIGKMKSEMMKRKEKVKGLEVRRDDLLKKMNEFEKLEKLMNELNNKLNSINLEIVKNETTLRSLNEKLDTIDKKVREMEELKTRERELRNYPRMREFLLELEMNDKRLKELGDIEEEKTSIERMKERVKEIEPLKERKDELERRINELEKRIAVNRDRVMELERYMKNLLELSDKAKCPRCGQRLTREHIERERNSAKNKAELINLEIEKDGEEMERLKRGLEKISREIEEMEILSIKIGDMETKLEEKIEERKNLETKIDEIKNTLREMGYRGEDLEVIDSAINELNFIRSRIRIFDEEIGKRDIYLRNVEEINKILNSMKREKRNIIKKLDEIKEEYDANLLYALRVEYENLQKSIYETRNEMNEYRLRIEMGENRIRETKEKLKEFIEISDEIKKARREMGLLLEARNLFPEIVKYLREKFISQLSSQLTYYFRRINQNPKYREISFDKEYRIMISSTEGEFYIDQLSGGEKVQLAIAFRIALLRLLSPIKLLILDEPFGSLDREHREILGDALNKMAKSGQLILVTHIPVDSLNLPERLDLGGY